MRPAWLLLALAACDKVAGSVPPADAQCVRDTDCTLVPSELTCCQECPPAPPYEAAPVRVVDGMYIENEDRCLATDHVCPEVQCASVPPGCSARAVCAEGRCAAVASGCNVPTS